MKRANSRKWESVFFVAVFLSCLPVQGLASECRSLEKDTQTRIEKYLNTRLLLGGKTRSHLIVRSISPVEGSCFWKVSFTSPDGAERAVYLSPDQRFLTSRLYDLELDPSAEVTKITQAVDATLMRDPSPVLAGSNPRVTVVEFGDFQCPYCKQFSTWYHELPQETRLQTRLVYKHLPLPQHPWARNAAIYTACVALQSPGLFWTAADRLFDLQSTITPENLENELRKVYAPLEPVKLQEVNTCVSSGRGASLVDRDVALARQLAVTSTPTIFINGRRILNLRSLQALEDAITRSGATLGQIEYRPIGPKEVE